MKIFISLVFLFFSLYAANPKVYATLGDTIYNNAPKIQKLKSFKQYNPFSEKIDKYLKEVKQAKELGFAIERGEKKSEAKTYLKQLRSLAKTNDFFVRSAEAVFQKALDNNQYDLVMDMLDTGLIDIEKNKEALLELYKSNKGAFEPRGEMKKLVDEYEAKLEAKRRRMLSQEELKAISAEEKIRRLREKDRKRQEELQRRLEEEVKRKKAQIRQEQIRELEEEPLELSTPK